ncbi:UvrD-helicase domain-containing protein [Desulfuromonas acetexigens]|uniref:DNA 3'-5' helicase n=1 Tax=Trichloromonas acetexigens TaxID=38815 RepID=A0A550JHG7_9BACT|nr:UvrD-helicase domain-containing protein [Desulfuromonas acetexigens]TRO82646.1 AAA family ATPase [Desulfuromonas acetexigens]
MTAPVDAQARLRAIDPERSFIVQAPAGSGKTELLIQRYLRLLATIRRPDEILAITFTRKAAGEMRGRLLRALREACAAAPESAHQRQTWELARAALAQDARQGWNLLDNPSLLAIQTIDSFNAALVRRMPWISRFGAMPAIAEDPFPLYREAARRVTARLDRGGPGSAETALLLEHLDNRMDTLQGMLVAMLARRDQWLRHLGRVRHESWRGLLEGSLEGFVAQQLRAAEALLPEDCRDELLELGRYAASQLDAEARPLCRCADLAEFPGTDAAALPDWLALADLLLTATGTFRLRLDKNGGFPAGKGEAAARKERMREILERLQGVPGLEEALAELRRLPDMRYPDGQWQVLQALVELLPLAAAELWLVFRQEGQVDFAAVALQALAALGGGDDPSELLLRLDARLSHILVDEFQDTSYLQYYLLGHLTAGWQSGDGRTLFVVGDPMQSIYLFREAEVGLFLRARARGLAAVPLERIDLCANFRSQQGIVDWVNTAFAGLFPAEEDEALGGVVYAPSTAVHEVLPGPACTVHPFAWRDDAAEAERVADLAEQALAEAGEGTVAVLVRARTHLTEILRAFSARGLRFSARDIDPLQCRPAVRDLLALTRALLHPADRLSWLCVLRAPWCGLTLADLEVLCGDDGGRLIPELLEDEERLASLSADGRERLVRVRAILQRARVRHGALPLRQLVEGVWLALGGGACCDGAARKDTARVFALMEECDHGGDLPALDALDEGLGRLFAAPDSGADGRLQVMTIHKSKGLEFDTVILPGLGRGSAGGDRHLLRWLEHPDCGLLLAPVPALDGYAKDATYEAIGRLETAKQELESLRLLYVAATRAKRRLHLLGHAAPDKDGLPRPLAGSLLGRLWPVLESSFVFSATEAAVGEGEAAARVPLPLRRLPADWRLPPLPSLTLPTVARARQASGHGEQENRLELFTGWEAETARHVGTLCHLYLERIAREGLERWTPERIAAEATAGQRRLARLGVPAAELAEGWKTVAAALLGALAASRGRWILGAWEGAACELELSGRIGDDLLHAAVDRTFVADGIRWVVDYKIVACQGGREAFLAGQIERYRSQLENYVALMSRYDSAHPVRAALYFPLFDGWRELD